MAVLGLMIIITFLKKKEEPYCGAVPGSSFLGSAVLRPATAFIRRGATASTSMLVFVLCARLGGFFSKLLYFSFVVFYSCFLPFVQKSVKNFFFKFQSGKSPNLTIKQESKASGNK